MLISKNQGIKNQYFFVTYHLSIIRSSTSPKYVIKILVSRDTRTKHPIQQEACIIVLLTLKGLYAKPIRYDTRQDLMIGGMYLQFHVFRSFL